MTETTEQQWLNKAVLYELLAFGLRLPTVELAEAVASGEFAAALGELADSMQLDPEAVAMSLEELRGYSDSEPESGTCLKVSQDADCGAESQGADCEESQDADRAADIDRLFHELRIEYTHLFIGAPEPAVSPYAGVWWAREVGVEPLLFVNKESMAVERFMRACGVEHAEGTNDPLDHIVSELEFLQYLCLLRAGVAQPPELSEGTSLPEQAYEEFYEERFATWSKQFAAAVLQEARLPYYTAVARTLSVLAE